MSSRLTSLLVQRGMIGVGELQDALALQVVRGGTLDTVLLERKAVPEHALAALLSEISGHPAIDPEALERATPAVAGEIPEQTARKLGICPVLREDDRLLVVSSEATDKIALPELAYELNCVVVPVVATELRVEQACSQVYGKPLPERFLKLLAIHGLSPPPVGQRHHAERDAGGPAQPADSGVGEPRRRTPTDRFPFVVTSIPSVPVSRSEPLNAAESARDESLAEITAFSPEAAAFELERAGDREDVLITLTRAARHHLAAVQLYTVIGQTTLTGRYAFEGSRFDSEEVRARRVALTQSSQIERAVKQGLPYVGPTSDVDATASILSHLGIEAPHIALIPIVLRGRTVALLIGHEHQNTIPHPLIGPLTRLARAAAAALARMIVREKRRTAEVEPPPPAAGPAAALVAPDAPLREVSGEIAQESSSTPTEEPAPAPAKEAANATGPGPKVIVEFDLSITTRSIEDLVSMLDERPELANDVLNELRRRARSAIPWLFEHFPGNLRFSRTEVSELPEVAKCSAVLQALVAIGRPVVARLAPLLVGGNEQARFFATYLLSELTYPETVSLLAKRLRDPSPSVRHAAIYGLRRSRELEQFPLIVEELRADLSHPETRPQLAAMEALAALGDVVATPSLIALLNDERADLAQTAHRALVQLTKQDFGSKTQPWMTWWNRNRQRHRVEWLIDALAHNALEIREQAFIELRDLTGLDFGYHPDLPPAERERLRNRFQQWWADTGLYDFGRFS